jgi:hypothetical protein
VMKCLFFIALSISLSRQPMECWVDNRRTQDSIHGPLTSFKHGMTFYSKTCDLAAGILCRTLPAEPRGRSSNTGFALGALLVCVCDFFDIKGRHVRPFARFIFESSCGSELNFVLVGSTLNSVRRFSFSPI